MRPFLLTFLTWSYFVNFIAITAAQNTSLGHLTFSSHVSTSQVWRRDDDDDEIITYAEALDYGCQMIKLMTGVIEAQQSQFDDISDLAANLWTNKVGTSPILDLDEVYGPLKISEAEDENIYMEADRDSERVPKGEEPRGEYHNLINVKDGFIVADSNYSPRDHAKGTKLRLPALKRLSDVLFLQWLSARQLRGSQPDPPPRYPPPKINYFWRHNIVYKPTDNIIQEVMDYPNDLPRFGSRGTTFSMDSEHGRALLGTAHGRGCAFFLAQHRGKIGNPNSMYTISEVQVFSTSVSDSNLLFKVVELTS